MLEAQLPVSRCDLASPCGDGGSSEFSAHHAYRNKEQAFSILEYVKY